MRPIDGAEMSGEVYAGIDLGGTDIKGGLVTTHGEIRARDTLPTQAELGPAGVLDRMASLVDMLQKKYPDGNVKAVGIGVPGQVIVKKGLLVEAPNLPGWNNILVAEEMFKRIGIPVFLDNDANMAGLGEYSYGAGKGCREMLMVTLGTGVGGGLILSGTVYRGASGGAGEFGHMIVCRDGELCTCGRKGCLEAYIGTRGILRTLREKLVVEESSLGDIPPEEVTPRDISRAAEAGDKTAKAVLEEAGRWLGVAVGSVANLLNLERAVIGGGVAAAGEFILSPAREAAAETTLKVSRAALEIVPASLGNAAGLCGAARLAMDFED